MRSGAIPDDEPARVLSRVPLFAGLDRVTLAKLAVHFERIRFEAGEVVFREGDPGDAFYVVLHGTFSDYVGSPDAGVDTRLATRGPGGTFGDIALLSNRPRSTTVRADVAADALRLERGRFLGLVAQEPAVALAIAATLSERVWLANVRGVGTVGPIGSRSAVGRAGRARRHHERASGVARRLMAQACARWCLGGSDSGRDVADPTAGGTRPWRLASPRHARGHGAHPGSRGAAGGNPGPGDDRRVDPGRRGPGPRRSRRVLDPKLAPRRGGAGAWRGPGLDGAALPARARHRRTGPRRLHRPGDGPGLGRRRARPGRAERDRPGRLPRPGPWRADRGARLRAWLAARWRVGAGRAGGLRTDGRGLPDQLHDRGAGPRRPAGRRAGRDGVDRLGRLRGTGERPASRGNARRARVALPSPPRGADHGGAPGGRPGLAADPPRATLARGVALPRDSEPGSCWVS